MPPVRSPQRLAAIVDAATEVFGRSGYLHAQMAEIARVAGVSVGTLYNYVAGKDALLLLCAEYPFGGIAEDRPLPVTVSDRAALLAAVDATLADRIRVPALELALSAGQPSPERSADRSAELGVIVGELFDLLAQTRRAADAMERCAIDAPDLAELFYRGVRHRLLEQLATYFERSQPVGLDPTVAPEVAARFVIETTTWWARHRHRDPSPPTADDAAARAAVIALIVTALCGVVDEASVPRR